MPPERARSSSSHTIRIFRCSATPTECLSLIPMVTMAGYVRPDRWTSAGKRSNRFSKEVARPSASVWNGMATEEQLAELPFFSALADADWERVAKAVSEAGVWLADSALEDGRRAGVTAAVADAATHRKWEVRQA